MSSPLVENETEALPQRPSSRLIRHGSKVFNAETPPDMLAQHFETPQRHLYVRNHGDVPAIDADEHELRVDGLVSRPMRIRMGELRRRFETHTVEAVMQCAGMRRADMKRHKDTQGDPWSVGVIGNCRWSGVRLADVLSAAGVDPAAGHVAFEGADEGDIEGEWSIYGVSIPLGKAMSQDVLLAYAINGEPLMPEHGFPLRVLAPGFAGARSVKWVTRITVQAHESDNAVQRLEYRLFGPEVTAATADGAANSVIDEMPLNSAILQPQAGEKLPAGPATVRGFAIDTRAGVEKVEASADGGRTWREADLVRGGRWSWVHWSTEVELTPGDNELVVRATARDGRVQARTMAEVWNYKGYLANAWHRISVRAE